jgi:DmsE family decaheme c-type cytochrome
MKKFWPCAGVILVIFLAVILSGLVWQKEARAQGNAGYVGMSKCQECHPDRAASFAKNIHARAWAGRTGVYARGCEACHGPGGEHVNNPSPENIRVFGKESKQSAQQQMQACLSCHQTTPELTFWDVGYHKKNDVACYSCHGIHTPKPSQQFEICFSCHKDIKFQANRPNHHPIIEGKVKCSDCHNPHGTLSIKMIRAENVNQLCYKCHGDKRGPFVWQHPPVDENCATCHIPHGTKAAKLLKEKPPNLCQDCHDYERHPGTFYDAKTGFKGSSPSNRFFARACLNCHSAIHGSNAPTDPSWGYGAGQFFVR